MSEGEDKSVVRRALWGMKLNLVTKPRVRTNFADAHGSIPENPQKEPEYPYPRAEVDKIFVDPIFGNIYLESPDGDMYRWQSNALLSELEFPEGGIPLRKNHDKALYEDCVLFDPQRTCEVEEDNVWNIKTASLPMVGVYKKVTVWNEFFVSAKSIKEASRIAQEVHAQSPEGAIDNVEKYRESMLPQEESDRYRDRLFESLGL